MHIESPAAAAKALRDTVLTLLPPSPQKTQLSLLRPLATATHEQVAHFLYTFRMAFEDAFPVDERSPRHLQQAYRVLDGKIGYWELQPIPENIQQLHSNGFTVTITARLNSKDSYQVNFPDGRQVSIDHIFDDDPMLRPKSQEEADLLPFPIYGKDSYLWLTSLEKLNNG